MALEYGIDLDEKIRTGEREIGLVAALREYRVRQAIHALYISSRPWRNLIAA